MKRSHHRPQKGASEVTIAIAISEERTFSWTSYGQSRAVDNDRCCCRLTHPANSSLKNASGGGNGAMAERVREALLMFNDVDWAESQEAHVLRSDFGGVFAQGGMQCYEERDRERQIRQLKKRTAKLGLVVV